MRIFSAGGPGEEPEGRPEEISEILVLGGSSLIGAFLLPRLASSHRPVAAISRRPRPQQPGVTWIEGDLGGGGLPELRRVSLVYCLAPIWVLPPLAGRLAALGVRRVVAFSSTSRFTKEGAAAAAERALARRLASAEEEAFAAFGDHGISLTILRPTLVYAEGRDGNVSRLAALIRNLGFLPLLGRGAGLRQPVHAEDLAAAALDVAERPQTFGRAYDVPGGETLTYREMTERIFIALGKRPRLLLLPPFLWRAAFLLARPFLPGATLGMGERMAEDLVFDPGPARRDFGWRPRVFRPVFQEGLPAFRERPAVGRHPRER